MAGKNRNTKRSGGASSNGMCGRSGHPLVKLDSPAQTIENVRGVLALLNDYSIRGHAEQHTDADFGLTLIYRVLDSALLETETSMRIYDGSAATGDTQ